MNTRLTGNAVDGGQGADGTGGTKRKPLPPPELPVNRECAGHDVARSFVDPAYALSLLRAETCYARKLATPSP
jgi:hypothetical protein